MVIAALSVVTACSSNNSADNQAKNEGVTNTVVAGDETKDTNAVVASETTAKAYSLENDGVDEALFNEAIAQFLTTVPERVVTTSVPLTEMLYLLGITPVGVPTSTNPIPADFETIE